MPTAPLRRELLALLALVLAFGVFGCVVRDAISNDTEPASAEPHYESVEQVKPVDLSYPDGRWSSETTLVNIDNEDFWFLGDKPGAQWGCTMVIRATKHADDGHLYTGTWEFTAERMEQARGKILTTRW